MEKVTKYSPLLLVIALSLKASVLGINLSDALIGVSLVALLALRENLEKHKKMREVEDTVNKKLEEMKNAINAQNGVIKFQAEEFDKLRGSIAGIKLQFGQKDTSFTGVRKQG